MDVKQIKALLRMFEGSSIHELEVESGEERVRLVRSAPQAAAALHAAPPPPPPPAAEAAPAPASGGNGTAAPGAAEGDVLKAPVVGTFYRAPSPGAAPFVEIGQSVKAGDVVCIVEAMKMMNHIEADKTGVVGEIFVEDGEPIEFDQPLISIV